jgi:hypothetical protein
MNSDTKPLSQKFVPDIICPGVPRSAQIRISAFATLGLVTGILLDVRLWLDSHLELM